MGMITIKSKGNFDKTEKFLKTMAKRDYSRILDKYAREGVTALASVTPVDSGETAHSWGFEIIQTSKGVSIVWTNSHVENGVPIAIILQYGHATRNGGYVQGRDYINPVLRPLFDRIASDIWREVSSS
jgi:hypothetical protein